MEKQPLLARCANNNGVNLIDYQHPRADFTKQAERGITHSPETLPPTGTRSRRTKRGEKLVHERIFGEFVRIPCTTTGRRSTPAVASKGRAFIRSNLRKIIVLPIPDSPSSRMFSILSRSGCSNKSCRSKRTSDVHGGQSNADRPHTCLCVSRHPGPQTGAHQEKVPWT